MYDRGYWVYSSWASKSSLTCVWYMVDRVSVSNSSTPGSLNDAVTADRGQITTKTTHRRKKRSFSVRTTQRIELDLRLVLHAVPRMYPCCQVPAMDLQLKRGPVVLH